MSPVMSGYNHFPHRLSFGISRALRARHHTLVVVDLTVSRRHPDVVLCYVIFYANIIKGSVEWTSLLVTLRKKKGLATQNVT